MGSCVVCTWCCCYFLCGCMNGASPVRFVLSLLYMRTFQMNPVWVVCVWLHLIEVCFLFICLSQRSQIQMTGVCLFVCVVEPGLDSTSPAFVRSRSCQAAGSDGRLAQKNGIGPPSLGEGIV